MHDVYLQKCHQIMADKAGEQQSARQLRAADARPAFKKYTRLQLQIIQKTYKNLPPEALASNSIGLVPWSEILQKDGQTFLPVLMHFVTEEMESLLKRRDGRSNQAKGSSSPRSPRFSGRDKSPKPGEKSPGFLRKIFRNDGDRSPSPSAAQDSSTNELLGEIRDLLISLGRSEEIKVVVDDLAAPEAIKALIREMVSDAVEKAGESCPTSSSSSSSSSVPTAPHEPQHMPEIHVENLRVETVEAVIRPASDQSEMPPEASRKVETAIVLHPAITGSPSITVELVPTIDVQQEQQQQLPPTDIQAAVDLPEPAASADGFNKAPADVAADDDAIETAEDEEAAGHGHSADKPKSRVRRFPMNFFNRIFGRKGRNFVVPKDLKLQEFLDNPAYAEYIEEYVSTLHAQFSAENYFFYEEVKKFRKLYKDVRETHKRERESMARDAARMVESYIKEGATTQINLTYQIRVRTMENVTDRLSVQVFDEAFTYIYQLMENDTWPRFKNYHDGTPRPEGGEGNIGGT